MPVFKCRNAGKQCRFEVEVDTEDQVLEAAREHMEKEHASSAPISIKEIRKTIRRSRVNRSVNNHP